MRVYQQLLLVLLAAAAVYALPARVVRQGWNFPDDDTTTQPQPTRPGRPPSQTTRQSPPSTRPPTTQTPGGSSTTPAAGIVFQIPNCDCPSPPQYNPVCGTDGVTYVNRQKLNCARQCGANVQFDRLGVCRTPRK